MHIVLSILILLLASSIYSYRGIQKNTKNGRVDFDGEIRFPFGTVTHLFFDIPWGSVP